MRMALASLLSVLVLPQSSAAQDTDAMQMLQTDLVPTMAADVKAVHEFSACAAQSSDVQSRLILRSLPSSKASDTALFWTTGNSCEGAQQAARFSPRSRRGAVAEYFLKRDYNLADWKQKRRPLKVYGMPTADRIASLAPNVRANVGMVEMGSCVARADPTGVSALIGSEPASPAQTKALAALSSTMAGCMPPKLELKMSSFLLRGYVAEGMYRTLASQTLPKDGQR